MPPRHAVQDQLLLHEVVRHGTPGRALDQEMALLGRVPRRIPDHALGEGLHPLRCDVGVRGEGQETGRHDGDQRDAAEIDPLHPHVALGNPVHDQVGFVLQQPLPGAGDRLELQVQPSLRARREEAAQQLQHRWKRAQVAEHHAQFGLLAHRQLRGVGPQFLGLVQQQAHLAVEGPPRLGEPDPIARAVQQDQPQLALQLGDGREDGGVRAVQPLGGRLETAVDHDGVEALQLMEREVRHRPQKLQGSSDLCNGTLRAPFLG